MYNNRRKGGSFSILISILLTKKGQVKKVIKVWLNLKEIVLSETQPKQKVYKRKFKGLFAMVWDSVLAAPNYEINIVLMEIILFCYI